MRYFNPILCYLRTLVFQAYPTFLLEREEKNGGNKEYTSYQQIEKDYFEDKIHPKDLKNSLAITLNKLMQPVRDHFKNDPYAKGLLE